MNDQFDAYAAALGTIGGLTEQWSEDASKAGLQPNSVEQIITTLNRADEMAKLARDLKASAMAVIESVTAGQTDGEIVGEHKKIVFTREDTEDWDQDALAQHYAAGPLPPHVTRKLSIPAKMIKSLPAAEQAALALCKRVKGSKLSIDIEEITV